MDPFKLKRREVPLAKMEPQLAQHLRTLRNVAPEAAAAVARVMFKDTLTSAGNKLAYEDFKSRPRGGVHLMMDGNSFGVLNKRLGFSAGDEAIKAMGGALSRASRAFKGKLFRPGGDEWVAHFPTPDKAYAFIREARRNLEALPPAGGTHHHSVSIGLGASPEHAEQALIHAKNAVKAGRFAPGHEPTMVHSLLPGAEGPVPIEPKSELPKEFTALADKPGEPLGKSELAKMAVLHDDPKKPMGVWRVENDKGEGPYHVGSHGELPYDTHTAIRELPMRELALLREGEASHNPNIKFAFQNPQHAEAWFGPEHLTSLRNAGFHLRQVLARKVWRSKSGKQLMFIPHGK